METSINEERITDPVSATELSARVAALFAKDELAKALGMTWEVRGEGRVQVHFAAAPAYVNGRGILHGGIAYTLGDTCFAYTCQTVGATAVTRHAEILYIAPGFGGSRLTAEGHVHTRYGRNIIVDVAIRDDADRHIAEMRVYGVELRETE